MKRVTIFTHINFFARPLFLHEPSIQLTFYSLVPLFSSPVLCATSKKMFQSVLIVFVLLPLVVNSCCLAGQGLWGGQGCRACESGRFDKRKYTDNIPSNGPTVNPYDGTVGCPMASADVGIYAKAAPCAGSGWQTACYSCPGGWLPRSGTHAFDCLNCPTGIVSNNVCLYCTSGQYVSGGCTNCPAGQYTGSFYGQTSCSACVSGKYCAGVQNTANNNNCDAGYYGSSAYQTSSTCNGACPLGQYCTAGSTSGTDCPAGTMASGKIRLGRFGSTEKMRSSFSTF